ncbi:MAG: signal recognition particle receptor subunit alpha, partial [Oscillospiraceae bacterium]|nr:signal recognition particle receptor subunit alpha [Oscillospiraceae bacterium]
MGLFSKFKKAWFAPMSFEELGEEFYEELEENLILADVGMTIAADAVEELRKRAYKENLMGAENVKKALREILAEKLNVGNTALDLSTKPSIVLIIGVNGVGKTTSIGKLGSRLKSEGKKVLFCAGDTFRAAAADQLEIWANRAGVDIVRQHEGADPGAVLFDGLQAAKARGTDVVLCDTAGRLHNKQ